MEKFEFLKNEKMGVKSASLNKNKTDFLNGRFTLVTVS
jgi:hypothetical protein